MYRDMVKRSDRVYLGEVNQVASQIGCGSKHVILSGLKQVRINQVAGRVGLTRIFHMIFFFF